MLRAAVPALLAALLAMPVHAQMGIQQPTKPDPSTAPQGYDTLAAIAPYLPPMGNVRVAGVLLRIHPTTRGDSRHTHGLNATYYANTADCELARQILYEQSPATLCMATVVPH